MIRFLLPIFLLLAAFPLAAQGCYENLQNGAGVSADPSRASTIACKLRESLPEANRASFTTYSASLYRFAGNFAPGAAEALVTRLEARAAAASPYYLLIVWESSGDNLFATPHVRVNLPADGPFTCLNPLRRSAWQARLLLQAQGDAPNAKDPEAYLKAETRLMEELMGYVKDLIKCCQEGQTCPDCITRKERIALLKAYPFRTIGQTSYNPAALKYRVDNVEIPGNSTAQIRDGIGIPLDLGGGPIDIAETLKQLALEKPELGLNALIVHDSLLCDPELLPGRFFGGLRSESSQAYVVLVNVEDKATGVMKAELRVMGQGNESLVQEILKKLTSGVIFGIADEAPNENQNNENSTDPCNNNWDPGRVFYTPSGKLIEFKVPVTPTYASGTNAFPAGALANFKVDNEYYIGIYTQETIGAGVVRNFVGYLSKTKFDEWKNGEGKIPGDKIGSSEFNPKDFIITNVSSATVKISWVSDRVGYSYIIKNAVNKGPFKGAVLPSSALVSATEPGGENGCQPCSDGPGAEFFDLYKDEFQNEPEQLLSLCQIAAIYNVLGRDVLEALKREDWKGRGMDAVLGKLDLKSSYFSPELYLNGLKAYAEWYKTIQASLNVFTEKEDAIKLFASLNNAGPFIVTKIPIDKRKEIIRILLTKNLSTGNALDKTYRKNAMLSLVTNIEGKLDKRDLMEFFIGNPSLMNKLFSRKSFANIYGDEKFKEFLLALIQLWDAWFNFKTMEEKQKLEYSDLLILGNIQYASQQSCKIQIEINNKEELFLGGKIDVSVESPQLSYFQVQTTPDGPKETQWTCFQSGAKQINHQLGGIIPVYFLTSIDGIGKENTESYIPAFLLPYLAKDQDNEDIREIINNALSIVEVVSYALGVGELTALNRLGKLAKVLAILDVVSETSEYAILVADPAIKKAFGGKTVEYESFLEAWKYINNALAVGTFVLGSTELIKNLIELNRVKKLMSSSSLSPQEEQKLIKLNNYADKLLRAVKLLENADNLSDLTRRLKDIGMGDVDAAYHADLLKKVINAKVQGNLSLSSLTDDFLKLYNNSADEMRRILRTQLSEWDEAKLTDFFKDLNNSDTFDFIKTKGKNGILAWEYLRKAKIPFCVS